MMLLKYLHYHIALKIIFIKFNKSRYMYILNITYILYKSLIKTMQTY